MSRLFLSCVLALLSIVGFVGSSFGAERPAVVNMTIPAYPAIAAAKRISGTVLVDVGVNREGSVIAARPLMGHQYLRDSAQKASLRWRFQPDNSVDIRTIRLTFIFHEVSYVAPRKEPDFTSPYQVEIEWRAEPLRKTILIGKEHNSL